MKNELTIELNGDAKNYPPNVIDIMPAIIRKIAAEPIWPPTPKAGELVQLKRNVA